MIQHYNATIGKLNHYLQLIIKYKDLKVILVPKLPPSYEVTSCYIHMLVSFNSCVHVWSLSQLVTWDAGLCPRQLQTTSQLISSWWLPWSWWGYLSMLMSPHNYVCHAYSLGQRALHKVAQTNSSISCTLVHWSYQVPLLAPSSMLSTSQMYNLHVGLVQVPKFIKPFIMSWSKSNGEQVTYGSTFPTHAPKMSLWVHAWGMCAQGSSPHECSPWLCLWKCML